ncbi:MAG TPA: sugar ABC transporter permease, partial [Clostridia bacterium]|nr:sugar ABC transporter permease [Clostridia bacterium]
MIRRRKRPKQFDNVAGYVFISPFIVGFLIFTIYPVFSSLYLSFTRYNILTPAIFNGLTNYRNMMADSKFWQSFWNTVAYAFISVPLRLSMALFIAMIMLRAGRMSSAYRTVYYLPSIMGGSIAVALMWRKIFASDGAINGFLHLIGIQSNVSWIASPQTAMGTLILLSIWQFGSAMLIFLAGLKQIPESYYEAALIDGANGRQKFFRITLPMLTPVILFNLVMQTINGFMTFTSSYVITQGKPMDRTLFFAVYMYRKAFEFRDMGYASAMAWMTLLFIAGLTALI